MANGIEALFAVLDGGAGGGDLTQLAHQIGSEAGRIGAATGVLPPDPAHALSAMLGTRGHSGGSHLGVATRGAAASRARPRYMAASATQTARALIAALTRAGG